MTPDLDRPRDVGAILDDAFALYRAHWRTLLAVTAAIAVPVQLAVLGVGLGWLWSGYDSQRPLGDTIAAAAAQFLVVTPLVTAMAVHVVLAAAEERRPSGRAVLAEGFDVFAPLFWALVLMTLGIAAGFLAFVVPGIFLLVRWAVVPQAVVVEGERGAAALRRSWDLVRGRGWFAFVVLLVVNLLSSVVAAAVTIPAGLAADAADAQALDLVGTIAGGLLTLPFTALAGTLLYFALRAGPALAAPPGGTAGPPEPREGAVPRPADPGAGDAWERRRREGWEPPA